MIVIEKEGKTTDAAIEAALGELNLTKEEVDIEILRQEGLFKTACVRVSVKQGKKEKALLYVNDLLKLMKLNSEATLYEESGKAIINLSGEDNGIAIGYRGEVLDAIQYLTVLAISRSGGDYFKVTVDAENYRNKRVQTLINLAGRLANKAVKTGRVVEVEPMNPYERKVFHTALSDNPDVKTESEGDEPNRYVVITPVNRSGALDDFSRKGMGKLRSFGAKRKFF